MPRTLAQNAQYIAETIKPAIKSAIEAQGVTVPSTDSFLDYADRIGEIEGGGSGYQLKDLPTGAISTVNDAAPLPLNALKVSVEAWQEGSGDPSPSNIRPIHGWDSGEITVCDDMENPTQTKTYTQQFPTTIYGGEWDVVGGKLKDSYYCLNLTQLTYQRANKAPNVGGLFFVYQGSSIPFTSLTSGDFNTAKLQEHSNCLKVDNPYTSNDNCFWIFTSGNQVFVRINVIGIDTIEDFQAWLNTYNPVVIYPLATPTTIDLSPLSIRLLEGTNNLYADCGDIIDGEYFVDEGAIDVRKVDYQIGSSGSIKTTDGRVLSGFASMNGYHARPLDASGNWLDVDWSKDFEVCVAFKYTDSGASGITVLLGYNYNSTLNSRFQSPLIYIDKDHLRDLCLEISSNGSSWMVDQSLSYAIDLDTWYALKLKFTLSTLTLDCSISTDFDTWTSLYSNTLSAAPYHSNTSMIGIGGGCQASAWSSNGLLIDTFNTYIKGDGVSWGASTEAFPS